MVRFEIRHQYIPGWKQSKPRVFHILERCEVFQPHIRHALTVPQG